MCGRYSLRVPEPTAGAVLDRALHMRVKRAVRMTARRYIDARAIVNWRAKTLLSVSLWSDLDAVRSMGDVPLHVVAARLPRRLSITTTCGVYGLAGDWRHVLFGTEFPARSPLHPSHLGSVPTCPQQPNL